ncbi:enoyl-CoA hydratase/isomerase family protein [Sphingobium tyrosinilyticum]|uniref:Enoyl-CoA hydratase/isomerase family protein n=1 Tax=Sphingobium tyrosinilyticum TaxID=2715436 RepID=A0ABV9F3N7_9SPHN
MIGIGRADHPQSRRVDLIVEPPISLPALARAIRAAPQASAIVTQLLRSIDGMPFDGALTFESLAFAALQAGAEHQTWRASQRDAKRQAEAPGRIQLDRRGETLAILLDRPQSLNAIDRPMRDGLFEAFSVAAMDGSIERVTLRGAGRCFSLGADLHEFGTTSDATEAHAIRMRTLPARALVRRPGIMDVHVQGGCVGSGLELAAYARRLTAKSDAWFQLPETGMGILPGAGGCVSLSRRIGRQRAAALILSGRRITARTALTWGLIDAITDNPDD